MGNDVSLLDKWYRTDFNAVPPVSILQPIDTYLVHFLNKRVPKLQARDAGIWWGTLPKMQVTQRYQKTLEKLPFSKSASFSLFIFFVSLVLI